VPAAEIVQVDAVAAAAERHLVLEGVLRNPFAAGFLEDIGKPIGVPCAIDGRPCLHVFLRVLVRNDLDARRKLDVAAGVVAVAVSVDDRRYRLGGKLLDLREDRLTPSGQFGVDHDDPLRADEDSGVPPSLLEHEQVVFQLVDLDDLGGFLLAVSGGAERQPAGCDQRAQNDASSHWGPSGASAIKCCL
jgi:hypothetical protein